MFLKQFIVSTVDAAGQSRAASAQKGYADSFCPDLALHPHDRGYACIIVKSDQWPGRPADPINTVSVTCVSTAMITGTVSGLVPGTAVTLNNDGVLLPVALNGNFSFPGVLAIGNTYNITIATQPVGENCTVLNGSGTVAAGTTINIAVSCTA